MTAAIGRPQPVLGPGAAWDRVGQELADTGSVLVYAAMPGWLPRGDADSVRHLLGRDWDRSESFVRAPMRDRFIASRLFLRHTAAAVLGTTADQVDLSYEPGGRPYVRGCDQIDVSLSHTERLMVVAVTRRGRIGVDVERADRRLVGTGSEAMACTPYERDLLDAGGAEARNGTLVRLWTLKEAYTKALGQGLRFRFTEFGFELGERGARLVRPDGTPAGGTEWTFATFHVGERYVVSAAVHDAGFGELADLSVATMLDEGLLDTLLGAPGPRQEIQPDSWAMRIASMRLRAPSLVTIAVR
ncbi:4'-phosphopantetheinyl transferase family protein [Streptomyces ureilyticus]|uniref:4'-phosphopantetheinyl transferase superfamily protein n=1 Tax=Streptomyces ureilyticus TaxID=1775131 RepID=A0ABX0DT74_9ACTN|nr:4'-phosphopantetheinyl transferase superfamily protein [Streptomyces ureilyticus]NGO43910.1 4'-phosphopantetheinyl transferase superfamily protein [Streptomyces ureilyticus]